MQHNRRRDNKSRGKPRPERGIRGPLPAPAERSINWLPYVPPETVAQSQLTRLNYTHLTTLSPGSPSTIVGWLGNSIITPYWVSGAPAGTQPVVEGVNAFSGQYIYYRVLGYRYKLKVINTGTNVVEVVLTHTNTDPAGLTTTQIRTLSSDGSGDDEILASASSGAACTHVFRGQRKCAAIVGKEAYFVDDNYGGTTGGSFTPTTPSDQIHITLMLLATSGNVTATILMKNKMIVELYNKAPQTS